MSFGSDAKIDSQRDALGFCEGEIETLEDKLSAKQEEIKSLKQIMMWCVDRLNDLLNDSDASKHCTTDLLRIKGALEGLGSKKT